MKTTKGRRYPASRTLDANSVQRRYLASLRMMPLDCGCRDPLSRTHLTGNCRWRKRGQR